MEPIRKPMVNTQFDRMNGLQRAMESFRYVFLKIEHWISPEGEVRGWMRSNIRVAVFMAAPTLLVFPIVTLALWELSSWVNALTTIAGKLVFLPILALLAFVSIAIFFKIISVFKR